MSDNIFKLDDIRKAAEKRYAPTKVEVEEGSTVELTSPLRLGKKVREEVFAAIDSIQEFDDDDDDEAVEELVCEAVKSVLERVCNKPKKLVAALDAEEDTAIRAHLYMQVLSGWMDGVQLGEAESSPAS